MRFLRTLVVAALALAVAGVAVGDTPQAKPVAPGLATKGDVPPGLAKKGGLPPGLAKKFGSDVPEQAYIAFDPTSPRYLYGGCYQGIIREMDTETGYDRDVMAYPATNLAIDPKDHRYRFNWNAPIIASPHDGKVIYHAGNVLFRTADRGNPSFISIQGMPM